MEQAYVDGERKRQELQHVMDSMFSRSAYTSLYRNHEKKKITLAILEAQLRFKLMTADSDVKKCDSLAGPPKISPHVKIDKLKKAVAAFGKRNTVDEKAPLEEVIVDVNFFNGLGEGRDLPRYLRSSVSVHRQSLQLQETQTLIKQFWLLVMSSSVATSGAGIHELLNIFFGKMTNGIDSVSLAYSLIVASQKYSDDHVFIEIFWKTWNGTWR
jgi:hypothetical protein